MTNYFEHPGLGVAETRVTSYAYERYMDNPPPVLAEAQSRTKEVLKNPGKRAHHSEPRCIPIKITTSGGYWLTSGVSCTWNAPLIQGHSNLQNGRKGKVN